MATYVERDGGVQAKVRLRGVVKTKSFPNKTAAREWATAQEAAILDKSLGVVQNMIFSEVIEDFMERLSPVKQRHDITRLKAFLRDAEMATVNLRDLNPTHVAAWRDWRAKSVSPGTILREWNTLSSLCKWAIQDKQYMTHNPFSGAKRPAEPPHRDRRPTKAEIEAVRAVTGYTDEGPLPTQMSRLCASFLFAVETGLRIGEIFLLKPKHVHLSDLYVLVEGQVTGREAGGGKTAATRRQVPLTVEAERIIRQALSCKLGDYVFGLNDKASVDTLWRNKIMKKAKITDLHFHDSRHEACSRLAAKIPLLDLARIMGIKDLSTLQVYYNPTATEIATRLRS